MTRNLAATAFEPFRDLKRFVGRQTRFGTFLSTDYGPVPVSTLGHWKRRGWVRLESREPMGRFTETVWRVVGR